jgi:hypothetical protein
LGFERFQGVDVRGGAHRRRDDRPDVGDDVHVDTSATQRHHDVGEQDRGVDIMPAYWLEGDLGDQFGVETGRHHGVLCPQRAVFGQ